MSQLRELLLTPPMARSTDMVNPLEKIEQLLTCAICLDRYKNPKLLPCHHTFCAPCLESCADSVHRVLKCPECRAEHALPYEGAKAFQTNFTLIGFLDIHLQASEDNAEQLEAYIRRYNLERCKVCDEKAELDVCAHCDRRVCRECRTNHMELLRRDLNRLLNQVKRLSSRITEASDGLSKGVELLTLNCETAKDEVREYFRRYTRELKKREDMFLADVDTFHATETRLMRNLRDILEIESSNMSEACALLEAALKGERFSNDAELVRFKAMFSDGLDYLRNFQPDADELFSKKLRFSPGDDASKLPQAICNFGELTVSLPQFAGRYLPLEQAYLPRPLNLGFESDQYKIRRGFEEIASGKPPPCNERPSSRFSNRAEEEPTSLRYRRRQQLEEEAWNRLRAPPASIDSGRSSPMSPWAKATNAATGDEHVRAKSEKSEETQTSPVKINRPRLNSELRVLEKSEPLTVQVEKPSEMTIKSRGTEEVHRRSADVQRVGGVLQAAECSRHSDNQRSIDIPRTSTDGQRPVEQQRAVEVQRSRPPAEEETRVERKPPLPRQASSTDDTSLNEKVESIRAAHEERRRRKPATSSGSGGGTGAASSGDESGEESGETSPASAAAARSGRPPLRIRVCRSSSITSLRQPIPITHYPGERPWQLRRRQRAQRSRTNPDMLNSLVISDSRPAPDSSTGSMSRVTGGEAPTRQESTETEEPPVRPTRFRRRSSIVPDREPSSLRTSITPNIDYVSKGKPRLVLGKKGAKDGDLNWPRGVAVLSGGEFAVCDSSNHRIVIFSSQGKFLRAFGKYGTAPGELDSAAGICCNRYRQLVVSDRYNHRIQVFDQSGQFIRQWGGHGPSNGRFNNPWGVTVDDLGMVYVVDKDNHRVQVFDENGTFLSKFGSMGQGPGQLHNPLFVAINRRSHQIYVTDSSNHRVVVFDYNGQPLFQFGQEGFHNGQFKFPRGICIDEQGLIVVADSGNNRVQVFLPDGRHLASFGQWGSGPGQMKGLEAIALMANNSVIVSDRENHRIQIF